jgi:DNA-binding SARP family transcriptional activator
MEIGVLGSLTFHVDSRNVTPSAAKPRKILALLAIRGNQFVPVSDLISEVWNDDPPPSVKGTLQSYLVRLRKLLDDGSNAVSTGYGGYRLGVERGALDTHRFEEYARRGRQARLAGDDERAAHLMRSALDVWRGPPLVDVELGPLLAIHAARLAEARLTVLEQLMESELRLGRHLDILGELTELTAQYPYHENLHAQLMTALYRAARRPQALEVFHRLRNRLADELGLDPSSGIQRLHHAVLAGDPSLDRPAGGWRLLEGSAA